MVWETQLRMIVANVYTTRICIWLSWSSFSSCRAEFLGIHCNFVAIESANG